MGDFLWSHHQPCNKHIEMPLAIINNSSIRNQLNSNCCAETFLISLIMNINIYIYIMQGGIE